jgi:hypothetical protein
MSTLKVNTIQPVAGTPSITSSEIATLSRVMLGNSSQTWTNVTASRAFGTTYTNSTGAPIMVVIAFAFPGAGAAGQFTVGGVLITFGQVNSAYIQLASGSAIVPPGATYIFGTNTTINQWLELR